MKRLILPAVLVLSSTSAMAYKNITQKQAQARATQVGAIDYRLSISLEKGATTFDGIKVSEFEMKHLRNDLVFDFDGQSIEKITVNGQAIDNIRYDQQQESIIIDKGLLNKGNNKVVIEYVGQFSKNGSGFHRFIDPVDKHEYHYTDFQPADAHRFFPHFDQPSLKATYTLDVKGPKQWRLISNMPVSTSNEDGTRQHVHFQKSKPLPSYLFHLSAGPYAKWQDNSGKYPMAIYARQSLAQYMDPERMFETTHKGFEFFESYYDFDYPFVKYDQIFVPEFNAGAMENPGAVTFAESMIYRSKPTKSKLEGRDVTILHEMAHMWFGDIVTMMWWDDLWLNESFADFMAYLGFEGIGNDNAWERANRRRSWAYYEDQLVTTHPIIATIPDILAASANFDGITYAKGQAALRQLQYYMGEDDFRKGVRHYIKSHAYKNTTLNDFIASLEYAKGKSLKPWVDVWLGTKDVNTMQMDYEIKNGKIANARVNQFGGKHDNTLRPHSNLIGLYYEQDGQLVLKDKVKITFDGKVTNLSALNGKKAPAVIVPNIHDYDYVKIRFDKHSMNWLKSHIAKIKDAPTKVIVWNALWDMVRDQEFVADEYFDLMMAQIADEDNLGFLNTQLWTLRRLPRAYTVNIDKRNAMVDNIAKLANKLANNTEAGSDLQRAWFDTLVLTSKSPQHAQYLVDLFDGKKTIDGIEIDTRIKWTMLDMLGSNGYKNLVEKRMEALLVEDKSALGKNYALRIGGAYPDLEVKKQVWETLVGESSYSHREKRSLARRFYHADHPEIAEYFIEKYFKEIDRLHQLGVSFEKASFFISALYPNYGYEKTVNASEDYLHSAEVSDTYKKYILKSLDELKRTIAVRRKNL